MAWNVAFLTLVASEQNVIDSNITWFYLLPNTTRRHTFNRIDVNVDTNTNKIICRVSMLIFVKFLDVLLISFRGQSLFFVLNEKINGYLRIIGFLDGPHQGISKFMYIRIYDNPAKNCGKRLRLRPGDSWVSESAGSFQTREIMSRSVFI